MNTTEIEREFLKYVQENGGISCTFGHLEFSTKDRIGQGGNGLVFIGKLNNKEVAIKFLIVESSSKYIRFKSEFFNTNYARDKMNHIVNMIHYEEVHITDGLNIPYIIMSKYSQNLKKYRWTADLDVEKTFRKLWKFLTETLKSIHNQGIIHRDLKPENILVDVNGDFVLTDFGIAHFEKEDFPIDNKTKRGERLANFEFAAPEQISGKDEVTQTADIYSMAQILYWFLFGSVTRGTGGKQISQEFGWEDGYIFDIIIRKCLRDNPKERFFSIIEIENYYTEERYKDREINPFEDMNRFHEAVLSVAPEFYKKVFVTENKDLMNDLFKSIFKGKYNRSIEFNTGIGNNAVKSIIRLENDDFLMGSRQMNIQRIWGFLTDDLYDDIILLEVGESKPYIINGKEYYGVAFIEKEEFFPYSEVESGYVRYKGVVHECSELNIQLRFIFNNDYKVIAIGPFHNSAIILQNDKYLAEMQEIKNGLNEDDIRWLKKNIHRVRPDDVSIRL